MLSVRAPLCPQKAREADPEAPKPLNSKALYPTPQPLNPPAPRPLNPKALNPVHPPTQALKPQPVNP